LLIVTGYKDYDDLGPQQKKRRLDEIGTKTCSYLNEIGGHLGLVPKSLELMSTKKNEQIAVSLDGSRTHIPSCNSRNTVSDVARDSDHDLVDRMLYLIMKHNIPMEFYHELTTDIPEFPRSYLVIGSSLIFINAVNVIFQIKSRKRAINHLPIRATPESEHGIKGSQFDFIELLRDRVKKQASDL